MVVRRKATSAPARRGAVGTKAPATKARRTPAKVAAAPASSAKDVTIYADKEPTDYHKAFATWIIREVGYKPTEAASLKAAFLAGVSIATAARPAFMESDFLTEWREKNGVAKRGPQKIKEAAPVRKTRKAVEVVEDDDFDDEDEEIEEDEDLDDEDTDDEDFDEDSDEDLDEDEDEDDEEEEVAPPRRGRPAAKKAAPAKRAPVKAAAKPATRTRKAAATDDDDFIF